MKLIKTGIAGLDEFLTGGLPPKIILLTGLPGSGNEIFARQIAYSRAKQAGITYFTVNTIADSVREDVVAYNWDIALLEASGNWKFKTLTKATNLQETIVEEMKQHRTITINRLTFRIAFNTQGRRRHKPSYSNVASKQRYRRIPFASLN